METKQQTALKAAEDILNTLRWAQDNPLDENDITITTSDCHLILEFMRELQEKGE